MAESKHKKRGKKWDKFCTVPTRNRCECGNDYIKGCDPKWKSGFQFLTGKLQEGVYSTRPKNYEAHHIMCVGSVEKGLQAEATEKQFKPILEKEEWCVNDRSNMLAMPVWGHTVKHYCQITSIAGGMLDIAPLPPPFADLPQHDRDHNGDLSYKFEVDAEIKKIQAQIEKSPHDVKAGSIVAKLNSLSSQYRSTLKDRGTRRGGTHKCWQDGKSGKDKLWFLPFSMASTAGAMERAFPSATFDERVKKWIEKIRKALAGGK